MDLTVELYIFIKYIEKKVVMCDSFNVVL